MGEISKALQQARDDEKSSRRVEPQPAVSSPDSPESSEPSSRSSAFPDYSPDRSRESGAAVEGGTAERSRSSRSSDTEEIDRAEIEAIKRSLVPGSNERHVGRDASANDLGASDSTDLDLDEEPEKRRRHVIPRDREEGWQSRAVVADATGPAAARFRHLAVRMRSELDRRPFRSVLVTSSVPGEGKTTVSVNLALALASIAPDQRIALVDLDLHRANACRSLGYEAEVGIEHVILKGLSLEEIRVPTDLDALDLYPAGPEPSSPHEILGGGGVARVLRQLTARYDYVVCDGPPVLPVPDVPLLAPVVGGCLVVARSRVTRRRNFRELLDLLPRPSILGVFMNDTMGREGSGAYSYYAGYSSESGATEPSAGESEAVEGRESESIEADADRDSERVGTR